MESASGPSRIGPVQRAPGTHSTEGFFGYRRHWRTKSVGPVLTRPHLGCSACMLVTKPTELSDFGGLLLSTPYLWYTSFKHGIRLLSSDWNTLGNEVEQLTFWRHFRYYTGIYKEGLRKTGKLLHKGCWCGLRSSSQVPSTYIQKCHRLSRSENIHIKYTTKFSTLMAT